MFVGSEAGGGDAAGAEEEEVREVTNRGGRREGEAREEERLSEGKRGRDLPMAVVSGARWIWERSAWWVVVEVEERMRRRVLETG